jgi:hypothetical protein
MNESFVDLEYMSQKIEEQEEALKVKTGVRAGWDDPYPPPGVYYGVGPEPY